MLHPLAHESDQPCVWMSAGLVDYKLCDHDFDCERCPLDAALRGESLESPSRRALVGPCLTRVFPEDRLYSTGHTWIQEFETDGDRVLRLGVDTFAAAIIGQCSAVSCKASNSRVRRHETICEIDLGMGCLPLGAPLSGVVVSENHILQGDPIQLVTAPYGDGWILDFAVDRNAKLQGMLEGEAAREQAGLDLRRFRRRVALQLFADMSDVGPSLADGGKLLTDLRQMLGGVRYLDLLRELIH